MIPVLLLALIAGKLADGWKGTTYGAWDPAAPVPGTCTDLAGTVKDVKTVCLQPVGGAQYPVSYLVDEATGLFTGVHIECTGESSCRALKEVLDAGWGRCAPRISDSTDPMADCFWNDADVMAAWEWNPYSRAGYALTVHRPSYLTVKKARDASAQQAAASDL